MLRFYLSTNWMRPQLAYLGLFSLAVDFSGKKWLGLEVSFWLSEHSFTWWTRFSSFSLPQGETVKGKEYTTQLRTKSEKKRSYIILEDLVCLCLCFRLFFFLFLFLFLFRASPVAYGGSQARGQMGAVAASLHHSHSNARFEPCLQSIP